MFYSIESQVDDRPLTQSAWKAWFGSGAKTRLERDLEHMYHKRVEPDVYRAEPVAPRAHSPYNSHCSRSKVRHSQSQFIRVQLSNGLTFLFASGSATLEAAESGSLHHN